MGVLLDPLERLKKTFAECVHVARWMGIDPPQSELVAERIYLDGISTPDFNEETLTAQQQKTLRPYIVIYPSSQMGYRFEKRGSPNCWHGNGSCVAVLSQHYNSELSIDDHFRDAAAKVEKILSSDTSGEPGLMEMAAMASYLNFISIDVYFDGRTPADQIVNYGDAYNVVLVVEYQ
jgi:hypothetical protein